MEKPLNLRKGTALLLISATLACTVQLLWKLASRNDSLLLGIIGLAPVDSSH